MLCDSPLSFNAKVPTFQRNDRRCPFRQPSPPELGELYHYVGPNINIKPRLPIVSQSKLLPLSLISGVGHSPLPPRPLLASHNTATLQRHSHDQLFG